MKLIGSKSKFTNYWINNFADKQFKIGIKFCIGEYNLCDRRDSYVGFYLGFWEWYIGFMEDD